MTLEAATQIERDLFDAQQPPEDDGDPTDNEPILATDAHEVERQLRRLGTIRTEIQANCEHAEAEAMRAAEWAADRNDSLRKSAAYLEASLGAYLQQQDRKTLKLINGTLKVRSGRESVEITDERALMASDAPGYFRTTTTTAPDKKAILDHIKATGEIPAGCDLVRSPDTFTVETTQ